jgi:deoxyhypusine monooxygenase
MDESNQTGFADDSALLKHELAYVLGQMKNEHALPYLTQVLENVKEDAMVRHEAAEAMGAIGLPQSLPILNKYLHDDEKVVAQTCELALAKIQLELEKPITVDGPFHSIDPAPPMEEQKSVDELKTILLNDKLDIFKRYRAMFSLRNVNTTQAVLALAEGFKDESALFRHEIGAFISIH